MSEWFHLSTRWFHVFAGILWIGATYYFTWLDGRLRDVDENPDGVWMVHSGGFYKVEKQAVPSVMPKKLHWFQWEAALTWISGIVLLVTVYWAGGLMIEYGSTQSPRLALAIGIGVLPLAWVVYDLLWISPMGKQPRVLIPVCFLLLVATSFALTKLMSGRAAYMHIGAMMGTLMAANVWLRILPAQRQMIAAAAAGGQPDLTLGTRAKNRSTHNSFMVVPVVFIMISNHFPTVTYGHSANWAILGALVLVGWGVAKIIRGR